MLQPEYIINHFNGMTKHHGSITKLGKALGYHMNAGSCYGITITWLAACMLHKDSRFIYRINKISAEKNIPEKIETVRGKVKAREAIDSDDLDLLEILSFYETMHLHQNAELHAEIFNKSLPQAELGEIIQFSASEEMKQSGYMEVVHSDAGIFSNNELGTYLATIAWDIDSSSYKDGTVIGFTLVGLGHAMGLTYEVGFGWTFMDINKWPPKTFGAQLYKLKQLPKNEKRYLNAFIFDEENDALFFRFRDAKDYPVEIKDIQKFINDFEVITRGSRRERYQLTRQDINLLIGLNGVIPYTFRVYEANQIAESISNTISFWPSFFSLGRSVLRFEVITLGNDSLKSILRDKLRASIQQLIESNYVPTVEQISRRRGMSKLMLIASAMGNNIVSEFSEFINERINEPVHIFGVTVHGLTPLYLAAQNGYLHVATELVKHGANINEELTFLPSLIGESKATPLFIASMMGHESVVRYLLEQEQIKIIGFATTISNLRTVAQKYKDNVITQNVELFIQYKKYSRWSRVLITPVEIALLLKNINVVHVFNELKPQEDLVELEAFIRTTPCNNLDKLKGSRGFLSKKHIKTLSLSQSNEEQTDTILTKK